METKLYPTIVCLFASHFLRDKSIDYRPRRHLLTYCHLEDQLSHILRRLEAPPPFFFHKIEYSTNTSRTYASICRFSSSPWIPSMHSSLPLAFSIHIYCCAVQQNRDVVFARSRSDNPIWSDTESREWLAQGRVRQSKRKGIYALLTFVIV